MLFEADGEPALSYIQGWDATVINTDHVSVVSISGTVRVRLGSRLNFEVTEMDKVCCRSFDAVTKKSAHERQIVIKHVLGNVTVRVFKKGSISFCSGRPLLSVTLQIIRDTLAYYFQIDASEKTSIRFQPFSLKMNMVCVNFDLGDTIDLKMALDKLQTDPKLMAVCERECVQVMRMDTSRPLRLQLQHAVHPITGMTETQLMCAMLPMIPTEKCANIHSTPKLPFVDVYASGLCKVVSCRDVMSAMRVVSTIKCVLRAYLDVVGSETSCAADQKLRQERCARRMYMELIATHVVVPPIAPQSE